MIGGPLWESLEGLLGKEGVATANGPLHRRQRRTIQPAFRLDTIPAYGPIMEEEAHALADRWRAADGIIDCTSESFRVAVRVAARCLLRGQLHGRARRAADAPRSPPCSAGMYQRMVVPLGPLYRLPLPANRKFNRALADLHLLVDEIVAERRASGQKPDDLLTALLEAKDDNGDPIAEQEIHDQVVAILTPGSETIASTIMWLLQVLTEHPEHAAQGVCGGRIRHAAAGRCIRRRPEAVAHEQCCRGGHAAAPRRMDIDAAGGDRNRTRRVSHSGRCRHRVQPVRDPARPPLVRRSTWSSTPTAGFRNGPRTCPKYAMRPFSLGNRKCPSDHFSMAQLTLITATLAAKWRFEQVAGVRTTRRASASRCAPTGCC